MVTANVARLDDGTIQINFSIPKLDIDKAEEKALAELSQNITVPGFRKGKAPIEKAKEKVDAGQLLEKTLGSILPDAYTKAIADNKIRPIIYPKFQIMKQGDDMWEVQAQIAELPEIEVENYQDLVLKALKAAKLGKDATKEQKEEIVIKTLLDAIKIKLAKILIDDEVNARLSQLLERTEKLGLKLEQYLASIGKTEQSLREEYEKQVADGISLELILNKIAEIEKVNPDEKDVDAAILQAGVTEVHEGHIEEQKVLIRSVLKRRIVLDRLAGLN
jgi:FKBP-type peptidyl-prolyl cis-trans isomerase (trigger factor)